MNIYEIITDSDDIRLLREYADDYVSAIGDALLAGETTLTPQSRSLVASQLLWSHAHWLRQKYAVECKRHNVDEQKIYAQAFNEAWAKAKGAGA